MMKNLKSTRILKSLRFWFILSIVGCASVATGPRFTYRPHGNDEAVERMVAKKKDKDALNAQADEKDSQIRQTENVSEDNQEGSGPRIIPQGVTVPAKLELTVNAPAKQQLGSGAVFQLTIQNIGDLPVEDVVVESEFDDAWVFPGSDDKKVRQSLGTLSGNDSKEVTLTLIGKKVGTHQCRFSITAKGEEAIWKAVSVEVIPRKMTVRVVGPSHRTIGSRAEFLIELVNVSSETLPGIQVRATHDSAIHPREATDGVSQENEKLIWSLGNIKAGEGVQLQAEFECRTETDEACLQIAIIGESLPQETIESCLKIAPIKGILDVQFKDRHDPVAINDEVEFEVAIKNRGLHEARDISIEFDLPENLKMQSIEVKRGMQVVNISHEIKKNRVKLHTISSIAADADLTVKIRAKAIKSGDIETKVLVNHSASRSPVSVSEITTIN